MGSGVAAGPMRRERLDERAALIAYHWEAAGEPSRAAEWNSRAAEWAGIHHPLGAIRHWRKVRELTAEEITANPSALALVARIWILELGWRTGIGEEEAAAVYAEARRLAEQREDTAALAMALTAYGHVQGSIGKPREYARLSREGVRLADAAGNLQTRLGSRVALTYALFRTGRFSEARAVAEDAIELTGRDPAIPIDIGTSSALACFTMFRGLVLVFTGRVDVAREELERAIETAERQGAEEVAGWARSAWGALAGVTGETEPALGHALAYLDFAERTGGGFQLAQAHNTLGWVKLVRGEWHEAAELLERSLKIAYERRTSLELVTETLAHLAEAHAGLGQAERARSLADAALSRAAGSGLPFEECAAQLSLARVLLRTEGAAAAQTVPQALERSLALARETGAAAQEPLIHLELAELARMRGDTGARERELREAQRLFAEIGADATAARLAAALATVEGGSR